MTGDVNDFLVRLKSTLPTRWFPDDTPVLDALLTGLSTAWSNLHTLLSITGLQARITTVTSTLLDGASADFFGSRLPRLPSEPDAQFRARVQNALVREHATRPALVAAIKTLTGFTPSVFEPARIADTGAYNSPALGYGVAGA